MPAPYCYEYPRPAVTVDAVVFCLEGDSLRVLMIRRKHDPFAGRWAIPGGFLEIDEPIEHATRRELQEETRLKRIAHLTFLGVFGKPGRDPRGRTISLAHAAVVRGPVPWVAGEDDAAEAEWLEIDQLTKEKLAFDHREILELARTWLAKAVDEGLVGLAMLPKTFSREDARRLHKALGQTNRAAGAWCQRLARAGLIGPSSDSPGRFRQRGPA